LNLDTVKIKLIDDKSAEVISVTKRFKTQFVGKVHINKKTTFVIPDNQKTPIDFYVKGDHNAQNNDKVLVELIDWEEGKSPKAKIIEVIGKSGENNAEMNSIMYEYGLPNSFPPMIEAQAELIPFKLSEEEILNRRDMRDVITFTIDP